MSLKREASHCLLPLVSCSLENGQKKHGLGREAMYEGGQNCSISLSPRPVRGAEVPSSLGSATEFWNITQEKMNSLLLKTTVCSELFVTAAYPIP